MTRWSEADLAQVLNRRAPPAKPQKYHNQPLVLDGERFDSKREARRWSDLKLMEQGGEISDLKRQVRFEIHVSGQHICDYIADATYVRAGQFTVEDTKSPITRRNAVYRLKRKLLRALYGLEILET